MPIFKESKGTDNINTVNYYRYKIRTLESGDGQSSLASGAVVLPLERSFSLEATCLDEAERRLCEYVRHRKLAAGRVYQICPLIGNPEVIRSVAICEQGIAHRVFLDVARSLSSEFRRLRYPDEARPALVQGRFEPAAEHVIPQPEAIPA
jgi:hypothetical protein